jgi:hypothetical protein
MKWKDGICQLEDKDRGAFTVYLNESREAANLELEAS